MPFSGSIAIRGINAGEYQATPYPGTEAGLQACIDDKSYTYVGPGVLSTVNTIYMPCDRPSHIIGSGYCGGNHKGTVIVNSSGNDVLRVRSDNSSVRMLSIDGDTVAASSTQETGRGIVVGRRNITDPYQGAGNEVALGGGIAGANVLLEDVQVFNTASWGAFVSGAGTLSDGNAEAGQGTNSWSILTTLSRCSVSGAKKYGEIFIGEQNTTTRIVGGTIGWNVSGKGGANAWYVFTRGVQTILEHVVLEGFCGGAAATVYATGYATQIKSCWFEESNEANTNAPGYFIQFFARNSTQAACGHIPRWITMAAGAGQGTVISGNMGSHVLAGTPTSDCINMQGNSVDLNLVAAQVIVDGVSKYSATYQNLTVPTLPDNTTPSVAGSRVWICSPSAPTTITNFTNGIPGEVYRLSFNNGFATLTDGGNLKLNGGFTGSADDTMQLLCLDGTVWQELSRSVN